MQHEEMERLGNALVAFGDRFTKALEPLVEAMNKLIETPLMQAWIAAEMQRKHQEEVMRTQLAIYTHCKKKSVQDKIKALEFDLLIASPKSVAMLNEWAQEAKKAHERGETWQLP